MSNSMENQRRNEPKKAYRRPTITVYGSVVELTKTGGVTTSDGSGFQNN